MQIMCNYIKILFFFFLPTNIKITYIVSMYLVQSTNWGHSISNWNLEMLVFEEKEK